MKELEPLRREIDLLDDQIIDLFARRFDIVRRVASIKHQNNIPSVLPDRIEAVKSRCAEYGQTKGLDPEFIRSLYALIIDHACHFEDILMAEDAAREEGSV